MDQQLVPPPTVEHGKGYPKGYAVRVRAAVHPYAPGQCSVCNRAAGLKLRGVEVAGEDPEGNRTMKFFWFCRRCAGRIGRASR